ncbi:acylneuraminate cytidylyltransferase family protein [Gammaproteobacteria bacterium]|nr:acylneuraminate cytidylyltransferase family protein [Gammaproteobacteria bacterium]
MKNYAFIFARGGSKGLTRKNVKELCGKPLIVYSIECAKACKSIDKVFVSTDDDEIASVAEDSGAILIPRPSHLATDKSPEWLSWIHAVNWVEDYYGAFDRFISLPCTSPLRHPDDIDRSLEKLDSSCADICVGVSESNRSPYFNMVEKNDSDIVTIVLKNNTNTFRRQDTPIVYDITTIVYTTTPAYIKSNDGVFTGSVVAIEIPKNRSVDIDDIYDFMLAEAILTKKVTNA